jgi:hypothetical protein
MVAFCHGRLTLFLSCLLVVGIKGKNLIKQASIQEVFTGETHEFTNDLGQLAKIVPPTNYVATPPENHGPQYRTVDWLKHKGHWHGRCKFFPP